MFGAILSGLSSVAQLGLDTWNLVQTHHHNDKMIQAANNNLTFQEGVYNDQKQRYEDTKANQQAGWDTLGQSFANLKDDEKESDIPTMRA